MKVHKLKEDWDVTVKPTEAEVIFRKELEDYQNNPEKVWNSEFFGRKLCEVINDGVKSKICNVKPEILIKFKNSMEKG